ncbi:MAG: hypothetical protein K1X88_26290 [Nannocystaceae bacterium]|nr:hypothetical protein [Nannocystaceae bacterium]
MSDRGDRRGEAPPGLRDGVKSALARWVLQKRRSLLGTPRPGVQDEATHEGDGRRRFAEDYGFAAAQPDLGLLLRLEWLPGRAAHRLWVMLLGEHGAWWLPPQQTLVTETVVDRWRVGGLALDCLQPYQRWSVRYAGPLVSPDAAVGAARRCELQLEFTAGADPFCPGIDDDPELVARRVGEAHWDRALATAVRRASQRGYVQIGRLQGQLALAHEIRSVDAPCLRMHTWGVRDWGAPEHAVQCFVHTGDRTAWIQRAQFPAFTFEGGFVAERDVLTCVQSIAQVQHGEREHRLELDAGGARHRFAGERGAAVQLRVDGRGAFELTHVVPGTAAGACGLWARQQRTLPRPGPVG